MVSEEDGYLQWRDRGRKGIMNERVQLLINMRNLGKRMKELNAHKCTVLEFDKKDIENRRI